MSATLDPVDGLDVSRDDLAEAVGIVANLIKKWNKGVSLRFEDGWLFIEAGHGPAVAKAPARGCWPLTIVVGSAWVKRLAKNMPAGDPIHLRVDDGRLYANRYS
jgi:predicted transcriptional regulator